MLPSPRRLMALALGAVATSIAVPRFQVVPPSTDWRTRIGPPSLMNVKTSPALGGRPVPLPCTQTPCASAEPPFDVTASTSIVPLFVTVAVAAPTYIDIPIACALLWSNVIVAPLNVCEVLGPPPAALART